MRLILALLLLMVTPAMAAEWTHYSNARFGFGIDIPPGFKPMRESANGDGQMFATPTADFTAYGGNIVRGDFEDEVTWQQDQATQDGWTITYQVTTPNKASFTGRQGSRVMYTRMIALCHGTQFAELWLLYGAADIATFDPIIDRMVGSLHATEGGDNC